MKTIRYWAVASLFAPLGLVASACYQGPVDTAEPEEGDDGPEYTGSDQDQVESTETRTEALRVAPVCKALDEACSSDAECCSNECIFDKCVHTEPIGGGGRGCALLADGAYCGGHNGVPGSPWTLYRCFRGQRSVIESCPSTCVWQPAGTPDYCL